MAKDENFDLVLMDIQMPGMNGLEATTLLRQSGYITPIVALTANTLKEDVNRYLSSGFTDVPPKPIEQARFFSALAKYLNESQVNFPRTDPPTETEIQIERTKNLFISRLPGYFQELKTAGDNGDRHKAKSIAHQLKGLGGSFRYPQITELAGRIEEISSQSLTSESEQLIDQLESMCHQICTE